MKGRLPLALCLAFGLLFALAPAAGAAGWGQKFSVSGQPGPETFSGPADVAVDAEGNATYVWVESSYGGSSNRSLLRSRVYGADGSVGPTRTLEEETGNNVYLPYVSAGMDSTGQVRIAWARGTQTCTPFCSSEVDFYVAPLDANGEIAAEPLFVTNLSESFSPEARFEVAPDGQSILAVVDSGALELWRVSADVQSAVDEGPEEPDPVLPSSLGLDVNGSGEAFVAWIVEEEGGTTSRVDAAIVSPGSETVETMDTEVGLFGQVTLDAAIDEAGNGTVVYSASGEVSFAQLMADGTVIAPQLVSPAAIESESSESAIDVAPDGTVLAAWSEEEGSVSARSITAGGGVGTPHPIATEVEGLEEPIVSVGSSNEGTVLFSGYGEADDESFVSNLFGREVTVEGVPSAPIQTLDTSSEEWSYFYPVAIEFSEVGDAAATWIRESESGPFFENRYTELLGAMRDATAPSLELWVPDATLTGTETVFAAVGDDPNPITYSWSFGDGATADGPIVTHAFDAPGEYTVSVNAMDSLGNSITQSDTIEVVEPASDAPPPPAAAPQAATPPSAVPPPRVLPQTKVLRRPPKRSYRRRGVIRFVSSQADARFECRVDRGRWHNCRSPMRLRRLSVGGHVVRIRAVAADGAADETPARVRFRVLRRERR